MNRVATVMLLSLVAFAASADNAVIGYVKTVSGAATVASPSAKVDAQPGTPIHMGDMLKTGANGLMGVTFKDNTVMSFGHGTEITVDEYLYAPGKDDLKLSAKITKGSLEYVSGVIAKLKPEAVTVKTPSGTIGARGTHFMVKVDAPEEVLSDAPDETLPEQAPVQSEAQ